MAANLETGHHSRRTYNFTCLNIWKCSQCVNLYVYQFWCFYRKVNDWFDMSDYAAAQYEIIYTTNFLNEKGVSTCEFDLFNYRKRISTLRSEQPVWQRYTRMTLLCLSVPSSVLSNFCSNTSAIPMYKQRSRLFIYILNAVISLIGCKYHAVVLRCCRSAGGFELRPPLALGWPFLFKK